MEIQVIIANFKNRILSCPLCNLSILEIEFSDGTFEEVKLTAQLFSRVINLEAKGKKEFAYPGEENIQVSWPIINQPIAILDTDF